MSSSSNSLVHRVSPGGDRRRAVGVAILLALLTSIVTFSAGVPDAAAAERNFGAPRFSINAPGDIVYVPPNGIGSWNDVVAAISPTIEVFSLALDPFVLAKAIQD